MSKKYRLIDNGSEVELIAPEGSIQFVYDFFMAKFHKSYGENIAKPVMQKLYTQIGQTIANNPEAYSFLIEYQPLGFEVSDFESKLIDIIGIQDENEAKAIAEPIFNKFSN